MSGCFATCRVQPIDMDKVRIQLGDAGRPGGAGMPAAREIWKTSKALATGSMSGCFATCCIKPIDMVQVHIQLGYAGRSGDTGVPAAMEIWKAS